MVAAGAELASSGTNRVKVEPSPGFDRTWATPGEGLAEVVEARIWSGFHFRTAHEVGVRLGRQVAQFVFHGALRETTPKRTTR